MTRRFVIIKIQKTIVQQIEAGSNPSTSVSRLVRKLPAIMSIGLLAQGSVLMFFAPIDDAATCIQLYNIVMHLLLHAQGALWQ